MSATPEQKAAAEDFLKDPDMQDAVAEMSVLVDLVGQNRIEEAVVRIEGWSRDEIDGVALLSAAAIVGLRERVGS